MLTFGGRKKERGSCHKVEFEVGGNKGKFNETHSVVLCDP